MIMMSPLILLALHLIVTIERLMGQQHQPLIFNPFSLDIYSREDIPRESPDEEHAFPYVLACPAQHDFELEFDQGYSLDNKSLFLKQFFENGEPMGDLTCATDYQLAVVYHISFEKQLIEFGFEVYYNPADYDEDFNKARYTAYKKIRGRGFAIDQKFSVMEGIKPIQTFKDQGNAPKMNFIWIEKVTLSYNYKPWAVKSVSYKVDAKAHKRNAECQDTSLGNQLYSKPNILDEFYLQSNQENVFSNLQLPTSLPDDCKVRYNCVNKYSLAPSHCFQPSESSPAICSDLTTIPVWNETEKLLSYLEKFLTVIAMLTKNSMKVTNGTLNNLKLPLKDGGKLRPIYLHEAEKKIPMPEIIYKTITYKTYDCKDPQHSICLFGVVIVIHNEPEFSDKLRICPTDECEQLGWESIQLTSADKKGKNKSKRIYCCAYHKANHVELIYYQNKAIKRGLNLKRFPYYDGKSHRNEYEDRQAEFEAKMRELFSEEEASEERGE